MTTKRYQIIWCAFWDGRVDPIFGSAGPLPDRLGAPDHGSIYEWRIWIGPIEIRKLGRAYAR